MATTYASISERIAAFRAAAQLVHDLEVSDRREPDRLAAIEAVLQALAQRQDLFSPAAFPRQPGTSGGLYRLAHSPDGRGGIYVSVGFTGRGGGQPHTHASWAAVVGISGGVEINYVYEKTAAGAFELKARSPIGPGDAILLPTGAYHTIEVTSETPVLHLHAYGHRAERPGFQPPLPVLSRAEAERAVAEGVLAAVNLDEADAEQAVAAVDRLGLTRDQALVLIGDEAAADEAATALYAAGYPVIFRLASRDEASRPRIANDEAEILSVVEGVSHRPSGGR